MNIKNLKTRTRMLFGFGSVILLLLLISVLAWIEMASIKDNMANAISESAKMSKVKDINLIVDSLYLEMWGLVNARDPYEKQAFATAIANIQTRYQKIIETLRDGLVNPREIELLERLDEALSAAMILNNGIIDKAIMADYQDDEAFNQFKTDGILQMQMKIRPALNALVSYWDEQIKLVDDSAERAFLTARLILTAGILLSVLFSVLLGIALTRTITLPIRDCVVYTALLGRGDFSTDVPPAFLARLDEFGDLARAFKLMVTNIRTLLDAIRDETAALSSDGERLSSNMSKTAASMKEIAQTTANMKGQTVNQSASVTETHATLEEIQNHIEVLNGLVENQAACVVESSSSNEQMVANIKSVVGILKNNFISMEELLNASESGKDGILEVSTFMSAIEKDSDGLMEAVDVIQGIASQTNLLAMNAAIEAAHAGTAGKGFAVVADEIRKLAENSASEGKKISSVLGSLKEQINTVALASNRTQGQFEHILKLLGDVRNQEIVIKDAMEEQDIGGGQVLEAMKEINGITVKVKDGSKEMLTGSTEVLVEMNHLASTTEEMSRGMDEIANGAEGINKAVQSVSEIAQSTRSSIARLALEIGKFTL